jgi:hypothetical protein
LALALAGASSAAWAVAVEFNVPVQLRDIVSSATHVDVTCGSWDPSPGASRFLNSATTSVPLQRTGKSASYNGTVKVTVPWPGAAVPKGKYRCVMAMRTAQSLAEFSSQPAAPRTPVTTEIVGDFNELNYQAQAATARVPNATLAPATGSGSRVGNATSSR